ncbi:Nickel/cobalt efflux system OS=Streptomyces fumanus OX=67302 GN=nicT PE=3 SV=1 [Streptomyces fumanus]
MVGIDLNTVGYLIGALFLTAWLGSFLHWRTVGGRALTLSPDPEA